MFRLSPKTQDFRVSLVLRHSQNILCFGTLHVVRDQVVEDEIFSFIFIGKTHPSLHVYGLALLHFPDDHVASLPCLVYMFLGAGKFGLLVRLWLDVLTPTSGL